MYCEMSICSKLYFENKGKLYFEATAMLVCRLPIEGRGSKLRCGQNILYFLQNPSKYGVAILSNRSLLSRVPPPLPIREDIVFMGLFLTI